MQTRTTIARLIAHAESSYAAGSFAEAASFALRAARMATEASTLPAMPPTVVFNIVRRHPRSFPSPAARRAALRRLLRELPADANRSQAALGCYLGCAPSTVAGDLRALARAGDLALAKTTP